VTPPRTLMGIYCRSRRARAIQFQQKCARGCERWPPGAGAAEGCDAKKYGASLLHALGTAHWSASITRSISRPPSVKDAMRYRRPTAPSRRYRRFDHRSLAVTQITWYASRGSRQCGDVRLPHSPSNLSRGPDKEGMARSLASGQSA
jgi:hypothetical protein